MNERLTELDVQKVCVDHIGRHWMFSGWWKMRDSGQYRFSSNELLGLFPDLKEHVPAWYEGAVAKGWVWNAKARKLVRVGLQGEVLTIEPDGDEYALKGHSMAGLSDLNIACGDLDFCLLEAEPLVWKEVTP